MMAGNTDFDRIEANASRDPAIILMATVFAKPDLYIAAGHAGFRLCHLRHLPSRCSEIMRRFAEAFGRTEDWEAVADEFRQRDPGFFRWLDACATPVDAERINELVAEVIAAANGSLNGTAGPRSNGGSVGDDPYELGINDPDAARIVLDAIKAMRAGTVDKLRAISDAACRLDPITQGDGIDYLSDVAIDDLMIHPDAVQAALAKGQELRGRDRRDGKFGKNRGPASDRDQKTRTDTRDRKRDLITTVLAGIKTATALQTMTFPQLKYIVPDLIVEGCVLLAGKPKHGKSWFALDVGLAVASARYCLGDKKCEEGDVLYLALEDGDRRLQRRITKLLPTFGGKWPERFNYETKWPRENEGGIEAVDAWCEAHPDARLVVVDVLAKFRAPSTNKNAYEQDYNAVSRLQGLAIRRSITILIVHHTRKGASEDPVEEISGTLGLGGGVDAFLILKRTGSGGTLIGRGRDTEDVDLAVQFSRETCRWTILGEAAEVHQSDERGRVLVALEGANQGLSVSEIIAAANLASRGAADKLLLRMAGAGQVEKIKRGLYGLPGTVSRLQREKREKSETAVQYGEIPPKYHGAPSATQSPTSPTSPEIDHTARASEFLTWALTPGRRLLRDIEASARAEGLLGQRQPIRNAKSFQLAREALGIVVEREGFGPGSKVFWRLPDDEARRDAGSQITREPEDGQ